MALGAPTAGFAVLIDLQTLFTHNHTIICGSLIEGLTNSPCARHAQAHCHKKDCFYGKSHQRNHIRLTALDIYSLSVVQFSLGISEIVSLLYIAKKSSVRVAIVLIKSKLALSRFRQLSQSGHYKISHLSQIKSRLFLLP